MTSKYACCIDINRLDDSKKALVGLENNINSRNYTSDFNEIEELIKNINFYHDNCIPDYKDNIDFLVSQINGIKRDINNLNNSLSDTIKKFSNADQLNTKDVEDIFEMFHSNTDIETLPINNNLKVTNDSNVFRKVAHELSTSVADSNSINTVPIGLGIGATGILASVGAVVVDSANNPKKDSYKKFSEPTEKVKLDFDNIEEKEYNTQELDEYEKKEEIPITPYSANRDVELTNKFLDNIDDEDKPNT